MVKNKEFSYKGNGGRDAINGELSEKNCLQKASSGVFRHLSERRGWYDAGRWGVSEALGGLPELARALRQASEF